MNIPVVFIPQTEVIEVTPIWTIFNEPELATQPLY